jgi:hypothetical protein
VTLIISEDLNLIVLDEWKVTKKFIIERVEVTKRSSNPLIVAIKHTIPGIIFNSHEEILLKFIDPAEYSKLTEAISNTQKEL